MLDYLNVVDTIVFRFMNASLSNPVFDILMPFLTDLNKQRIVLVIVATLLLWMIIRGNKSVRLAAILLIVTIIISDQINSSVIKFWLLRQRPCHILHDVRLLVSCGSGLSFPSSHAVNNFAGALVLAFFLPRAKWWFFGFAATIAFSRVYVGVHYPFDVIGGSMIGLICGGCVLVVFHGLEYLWCRIKPTRLKIRKFMTMVSTKQPFQERILFRLCLAVMSGLLLGFSFPPSPFYSLAYVAFIPLFYLFAHFGSYNQIAKYSYLFLLVFHLLTVYWTGGYSVGKDIWMMTAGAAVIFIHPMFFLPFILVSFFVRKRLGLVPGLIAFALLWTSFEYLHSLGEYSFPWLTIGNSQAYDLNRIQIIEYSSIYGLTLLIFAFNILAFLVLWKMANSIWKFRSLSVSTVLILLVVLYFGPVLYGKWIIKKESIESGKTICVGVIQPNFDPWDKWGEGSREKWDSYFYQFNTYIEETKRLAHYKPDIVFWPETAIPFHILLPRYSIYLSELQSLVDTLRLPIFTGLPTIEYFDSLNAPATAQRISGSDFYAESYNSAIFIQPKCMVGPIHKKSILVPFAERIPYAETFRFLIEPLKWNVGISSWGKGEDTLIYTLPLNNRGISKFSGMICYESAYPNYVREFVKRGAEFLVILTNDSWWGNTSGAYQHASFASLRAVETRRWVVQCANGGISLIVDPTGTTRLATSLYSKARFVSDIGLRSEKTFYVKHGDLIAQLSIAASVMMLLAAVMQKRKVKRN